MAKTRAQQTWDYVNRSMKRQVVTVKMIEQAEVDYMEHLIRRALARNVAWGNWGIQLRDGSAFVAEVPFPVGPQGPMDGTIGSPLRLKFEAMCKAWKERGEMPEGAVCYISQKWLYVLKANGKKSFGGFLSAADAPNEYDHDAEEEMNGHSQAKA